MAKVYAGNDAVLAEGLAELIVQHIPQPDLPPAVYADAVQDVALRFVQTYAKRPEQQDVVGPLTRIADALERLAAAQETIAAMSSPPNPIQKNFP